MKLSEIKPNPNNPRLIRDEKFKNLVKSVKELPVMTELREVLLDENNVIIGGNMRYRAAQEAGWKEIQAKVFTREMADRNNELTGQNKTYEEYVKEILIKDNRNWGEFDWDMLANDFTIEELKDLGFEEWEFKIEPLTLGNTEDQSDPVKKSFEVFENGSIKQVVLVYSNEEYELIIPKLNSLREKMGFDNNTDVITSLINSASEE